MSLQFEWAEVYAHFVKQLLPCDGPECARWVPGEQYWPSYSKGGFSLTQTSWKVHFRSHSAYCQRLLCMRACGDELCAVAVCLAQVDPSAHAAMLQAQSKLRLKPDAEESVFCGPSASNPRAKVPLAPDQCLTPGEVLGMDFFVEAATLETTLEPAVPCKMGSVRLNDGYNCSACAPGFYSAHPEASACAACSPGAQDCPEPMRRASARAAGPLQAISSPKRGASLAYTATV